MFSGVRTSLALLWPNSKSGVAEIQRSLKGTSWNAPANATAPRVHRGARAAVCPSWKREEIEATPGALELNVDSKRDVDAVQAKLERIGVRNIPELVLELRGNSLNESLKQKGEKRFASVTLSALKKFSAAEELRPVEREPRRKRRPAERRRSTQEKCFVVASPQWNMDRKDAPLQTGHTELKDNVESDEGLSQRPPLETLTDAELWEQYKSEGIAPPSFVREDLIAMLQAVRSWPSASRAELLKLCRRNGIHSATAGHTQAELCQRLKSMTWEAWQIPVNYFLQNGNMAGAYALLEHFQELETLNPGEERLKLLAFWEQLPWEELETECWRQGLRSSAAPFFGYFQQSVPRQELMRILIQTLHNDALARWLGREGHAESCADDELTSAPEDDLDGPFVCLECGCWAHPDGEAAWVDGHKCCDESALRIYYEEKEKEAHFAAHCDEDLEEAEVFDWLHKWRASKTLGREEASC
eukprot:g56.t1